MHRGRCAAGKRCISYIAELAAMQKLLDDLIAGCDDSGAPIEVPAPKGRRAEIRIALDSQSAIRALAKGPSSQEGVLEMRVWERLIRVCRLYHAHVTVAYVPGHCDLAEQELADVVAKEAADTCPQGEFPLRLCIVKAVLRGKQRERLRGRIAEKRRTTTPWTHTSL